MTESGDGLHYDVMVENALRGVVREALTYVAEHGLPGEHHFYITFRSEHPGVDMPATLRERYPHEMTVVLQYQFWDLDVGEDAFAVTLSFNNRSERVVVPFAAVTSFADPSVRFGLQFEAGDDSGVQADAGEVEHANPQTPATESAGGAGDEAAEEAPGDNVVTLDRFRRKE
ncbi:hypothetical protein SAMN05216241_10821 [Limimonas halophila]|uniref:Stringent starvation protein B n=1 Tax=Limimonas halophila TaxID=1082479 RepID=A0A1G7SZM9_9PROT|nr:ClpXP protease specificity-enhancing factor SspB [Limimonas halophila]SDG28523.1 hypothetical protein SAMN05216241_10821 [Limimonas halophila]